jgi:hypothetical protein
MKDIKTSIFVRKQLPDSIRSDYPKFVSFLEAYYEFLENEKFTNGVSQKNDLISKLKDLRTLPDVDQSLDLFEDQFFSTYASYIPKDVEISKDFLIKRLYPLYNSKGSEKSFKFLFNLLFGEDVKVTSPKTNILKASSGNWSIETILRADKIVQTLYTGNGTTKEFKLSQVLNDNEITVLINGVKQTSGYYIKKEVKKLVFNSAPANNANVVVSYSAFDYNLIENRQITGRTSGAKAVIEKVDKRIIGGDEYLQVYINNKQTTGVFVNGEYLDCDFYDSSNVSIKTQLLTLSQLKDITVTEGGANYNIGDPVIVLGNSTRPAVAVVSNISSGVIDDIGVAYGGAGFKVGNLIQVVGISDSSFNAEVITVDTSGINSSNTVNVNTDLIVNFENVVINAADYGFAAVGSEDQNTIIANALTNLTITNLGPITQANVINSTITFVPTLTTYAPLVSGNVRLNDLGIIGRININFGGAGYANGDLITFTRQPGDFFGVGANAAVSNVDANGKITRITITTGGLGYKQSRLPTLSVTSANGTNANIQVTAIMGDGEILQGLLPLDEFGKVKVAGEITSIKILDAGEGYNIVPGIDLSKSGDGTATAAASVRNTFEELPGKWTNFDGILSSYEAKLQGRNYYVNFSYLLSSRVQFRKYRDVVKKLLHPAGMIDYSEFNITKVIDTTTETTSFVTAKKELAGLVDIGGEIATINIAGGGWGYSDGNLRFSSNSTNIAAEGYYTVNANGTIVSVTLNTKGVYSTFPTIRADDGNNKIQIFTVTANSRSYSPDGNVYLTFTGGGTSNVAANAQVKVNAVTNQIVSVVLLDGGKYITTPNATATNTNAVFTIVMKERANASFDITLNNNVYIIGTNSKFILANSRNLLTIASNVSVNGEDREVDVIISNTVINVTSQFTSISTNKTLTILT